MAQRQPVGPLLDSLGVEREVVEGELVVGAVVLLKVLEDDGTVTLRSAWSPGMSWIERVGMHTAAAETDLPPRTDQRGARGDARSRADDAQL